MSGSVQSVWKGTDDDYTRRYCASSLSRFLFTVPSGTERKCVFLLFLKTYADTITASRPSHYTVLKAANIGVDEYVFLFVVH